MTEYIEREAAIEAIMCEPPDAHYPQWYADKIKAISAADVVPVRWQPVLGYEGLYEGNQFGYVHRIVAQAFIPNPQGFEMINHKDEDGTNNIVDNLEWCDRSYNATYGSSPKKISKAFKGRESKKRIAVYATKKSGDFAGEWGSITEAAKDVGCSTSEISGALKGKRKTVKCLIWNYFPNCGSRMDLEEPNEAK